MNKFKYSRKELYKKYRLGYIYQTDLTTKLSEDLLATKQEYKQCQHKDTYDEKGVEYCNDCGDRVIKQEDKKEEKKNCGNWYETDDRNTFSPSLLNDIETIEEVEIPDNLLNVVPFGAQQTTAREFCNWIEEITKGFNTYTKNQRILTEIIKSLMEDKK